MLDNSDNSDSVRSAFFSELVKISAERVKYPLFTPAKVKRDVGYQFSSKAGKDKWDKLEAGAKSKKFINALKAHPKADKKLLQHANTLYKLHKGRTVGKVKSKSNAGTTYLIRKLSSNSLGCTCRDWKFNGTLKRGYKCKHIKAYKKGKTSA